MMKEHRDASTAAGGQGAQVAGPAPGKTTQLKTDEPEASAAKKAEGSGAEALGEAAKTALYGANAVLLGWASELLSSGRSIEKAIEHLKHLKNDCSVTDLQARANDVLGAVFGQWLRDVAEKTTDMARAAADLAKENAESKKQKGGEAGKVSRFIDEVTRAAREMNHATTEMAHHIGDINEVLEAHAALCGKLHVPRVIPQALLQGPHLQLKFDERLTNPFAGDGSLVPQAGGGALTLHGLHVPKLIPGGGSRLPKALSFGSHGALSINAL
jgi:hypothetical protein